MTEELMTPHYAKIPGFVCRTARDFPDQEMTRLSLDHHFRLDFLPPKPTDPSLVSTNTGAIDRILLTIPNYAVGSFEEIYKGIFEKLPQKTKFVVATHASAKNIVETWIHDSGADGRVELFEIPDHLHFSVWAEDGYVISKDIDSSKTYFVEPFAFPRYGDGLIADFAANATDLENTQAPLYFQGGNVLIGDDFFLIGADYPANTLEYTRSHIQVPNGTNPAQYIKTLYNEYLDRGRKLHYVASTIPVPSQAERQIVVNGQQWKEIIFGGNKSGTVQPLFHIDMFLTLIGRNQAGKFQIMVGDPKLAAEILGETTSTNAMVEVFDNIARGLARLGFEVVRNPLPLVYEDDPTNRERFWYFATSNNCLVQNSATEGKIVWLPTYGYGNWTKLEATDDATKVLWEGLGFEVRQLGDFHPFAVNLGALHCIKKFLGRSGPPLIA